MKKSSKAAVVRRTEEVLRIRLDGAEFVDIRNYVREQERQAGSPWELPEGETPLSDSQIWRYMARADGLMIESCRAYAKKLLRRHMAQRRNLYAKAVSQGDIRTALAVLDSEARMLGLDDQVIRKMKELEKEVENLTKSTPTPLKEANQT